MTPRPLGHSFPNGIQQDLPCERLAQIADAPGVHRLIARGLVKSALQLDPRNSSEVDVEQQVEVGLFVCSCAGAAGVPEIVATPTRISLYGDGERCGYPRSAGRATIYGCFRGDISEELTMTKSILISLAVLTLSTSAALAAHRTHHRHAMNAYPSVRASPVVPSVGASPVLWTGGVSSSDRALYIKNLHDSGVKQ